MNDDLELPRARVKPRIPVGNSTDLIRLISEKYPRTAMAIAAGQIVLPYTKNARMWLNDRRTYTIKVLGGTGSNDSLYDDLHEWVLSILPPGKQRALVAYVPRGNRNPYSLDFSEPRARIRLRYDGSREQDIMVDGYKISVSVTDSGTGGSGDKASFKPPEIVFTMTSVAARNAMLAQLDKIIEQLGSEARDPMFYMLDYLGDWGSVDSLPPRPLDSVVLPVGKIERLETDLRKFLSSEAEYNRRSIPWHRGYMLAGPPGTGKTSLARALASHFRLDMWYLPLADVNKDTNLIKTVNAIRSGSMLLLEDIDIYHIARERDDVGESSTLSGLLNSLDGIATPHGLVTMMTTNDITQLDPALLRYGRSDVIEHFDLSGPDEARRLIQRWYDTDDVPSLNPEFEMSAAEIVEHLRQSDTIEDAIQRLEKEKEAVR